MIVPVIVYKDIRPDSKKYVEAKNAELKLLSNSRKISNLIFSLDFYQAQPLGDKVRPSTYNIYFTDGESYIISDKQTVIADKTDTDDFKRVFHLHFNLKSQSYDRNHAYVLVITNGVDIPSETEFTIDISCADDFGFNFE